MVTFFLVKVTYKIRIIFVFSVLGIQSRESWGKVPGYNSKKGMKDMRLGSETGDADTKGPVRVSLASLNLHSSACPHPYLASVQIE